MLGDILLSWNLAWQYKWLPWLMVEETLQITFFWDTLSICFIIKHNKNYRCIYFAHLRRLQDDTGLYYNIRTLCEVCIDNFLCVLLWNLYQVYPKKKFEHDRLDLVFCWPQSWTYNVWFIMCQNLLIVYNGLALTKVKFNRWIFIFDNILSAKICYYIFSSGHND